MEMLKNDSLTILCIIIDVYMDSSDIGLTRWDEPSKIHNSLPIAVLEQHWV